MQDGKWHHGRIYDLLVNECVLQIFKLRSCLEGLAPLSGDEFLVVRQEMVGQVK